MRWFVLAIAINSAVSAAEPPVSMAPLAPIVGTWVAADGSARQVFEWGLDQRIMHTRMYFKDVEQWKLVSEGAYVCDTIDDRVRGFAVGIDMGVDYFAIELLIIDSFKVFV